MDLIKGTTVGIGLLLIGLILLLLGITDGIHVGDNAVFIENGYIKIASSVFGIGLIMLAIYKEYSPAPRHGAVPSSQPEVGSSSPETATPVATASMFFHTLASRDFPSFAELSKPVVRVRIMARTVVNLLNQYRRNIEELADRGAEIDILIVDPVSDSAKYLYGANFELYAQNANRALTLLSSIQGKYPNRINIRFFHYVPTMSIMIFEQIEKSKSTMQVQLYFIHSAIGADRPIFAIGESDPWYRVFDEEFESIWNARTPVRLTAKKVAELQGALS